MTRGQARHGRLRGEPLRPQDPAAVQQRVVLETSSRHGLPTPADENVVLALLYVAKHTHDFREPVVHFAPRQLFDIMGWAPNSRSYDRLRDVLRRLQGAGDPLREFVVGHPGPRLRGGGGDRDHQRVRAGAAGERPRQGEKPPPCWVCWTPHFQRSLSNGNLKKLDLEPPVRPEAADVAAHVSLPRQALLSAAHAAGGRYGAARFRLRPHRPDRAWTTSPS